MLAPATHILPLTNIRRTRLLPVPGQVLVRSGQLVSAADVVAQATIPSGHMVVDIRRALGISQVAAAERCIVRQPGDRLEHGDTIAESGGLFSRIIRAPAAGEIVLIRAGQVVLRTSMATVEARAGFSGTVAEISPEWGAVIETNGALIQGVWGNGQIDSGMLWFLEGAAGQELTGQHIDVSMRGSVVVAGHCASADALHAANDLLRGLVLASMSADLVEVANSLSCPVMLVEGFGRIPMNEVALRLITSSDKRDVSVNASFRPEQGERPEMVVPLQTGGQPAGETGYLAPNQRVRIQGAPYAGRSGTVVQLHRGLTTLPSGIKAAAADVQLEGDARVTVPLANLEVIE